jgi:hypothetical protein
MKGRYWVGLMGAIAVLAISACANLFLPLIGGLLALVATVIGGAFVGYIVTRVDEDVKANPAAATNAGAVAGLITGVGAAVGFIVGALLLGALVSMSADFLGPEFEQSWRSMLRSMEGMPEYESFMADTSFESLMGLVTTVSVVFGLCLGVTGVALTTGAAALTARLSAPTAPPARDVSLPAWGQTPPPDPTGGDDSEPPR